MPAKKPDKPEPQPDPADSVQPPEHVLTMDDVLVAMAKDTFPEGAMCTGWVIVSEWMDADGQFWTYVGSDDRNPPWRHLGMLSWTLETGNYASDGDSDEDTDDDD